MERLSRHSEVGSGGSDRPCGLDGRADLHLARLDVSLAHVTQRNPQRYAVSSPLHKMVRECTATVRNVLQTVRRMTDSERRDLAHRLFGKGKGFPPGPIDAGWVTATLLGGNRMTLHRWRKGGIPADRLEDVYEAVRSIVPEAAKEAAPSVLTRRLLAGVRALEKRAEITPEELAVAQREAAELESELLEIDREIVADAGVPGRQPASRTKGQAGGRLGGSQGSKR